MRDHYDAIVMGAGPAGSMAAGLVAEAGFQTLLLEREKFPRFHVGESLMPETFWPLKRFGVIERMRSSQFTRKYSVQFVASNGKESTPFYFQEHDPRESSVTWQVERADFDKMLFDRAAEFGAECYDETRVMDVLFGPNEQGELQARGVRLRDAEGNMREVTSKVLIDATGQQSLIGRSLGLLEFDPSLRKSAIWSYWKGALRDPDENAGATIIMHTQAKDSWFWFIPLADDVTSIGCVGDTDYLLKRGTEVATTYHDEIAICSGLIPRLQKAKQVGETHVAKEYTYSTKQHAGPGWVLVGDAFGFIDPIYSSGVYFALVMAEKGADAVIEGLQKNDLSAMQLGKWTTEFKEGAKWIRKLIDAYYTKEFSFGGFMKSNPQFKGNLVDLLIGRIFHDDAGTIFKEMDPAIVESLQGIG